MRGHISVVHFNHGEIYIKSVAFVWVYLKNRLIMKTIVSLVAILTGAFAHGTETRSTDNYAADYAFYATYFHILSEATAQSGEKYAEVSAGFNAKCDEFLLISLTLAQESRSTEMAQKVTLARFESFKKEMLKEIEHRNENISILVNKYNEEAMRLATSPPSAVVRILERRAKELSQ